MAARGCLNDGMETDDATFSEEDNAADEALYKDSDFRRGAAHGVTGARKFIGAAMSRGQTPDQFLADYEGVLLDWRNGRTEPNGYAGNPWTWSIEEFQTYVATYGPDW